MKVAGTLATKFSPPFDLILRYFVASIVFYIIFYISIFAHYRAFIGYPISFGLAFLTHLYVLGFILMVMFGAMYQLIPVSLEVPIFSTKIAYWQFYIYLSGVILMVCGFERAYTYAIAIGASFLFISIFMFIINFLLSAKNINHFNIISIFLTTAVLMLGIGVFIGFLIGLNLLFGFIDINIEHMIFMHAGFMIFGFILFSIMGISMVLLPMFSLSHNFSNIPIKLSYTFGVLGLLGFELSFFILKALKPIFFSFMLLSILFYLIQVFLIYRGKPKSRTDTPIKAMFLSNILLILSVLMLLYSYTIFGILMFMGFFSFLIYANMYKIVPFLTWFHRFSRLVGKQKVPMLVDMLPKKIPEAQLILNIIGLSIFVLSVFLKSKMLYFIACFLMLIGAFMFAYNIIYVLRFKKE